MDQAQGTSTWIRYFTTLLASSILRAMRLTVELMRAKPARPRIFNFVSAKINTIQTYVKRKAHKIFRHRFIQTNGNKKTSEKRNYNNKKWNGRIFILQNLILNYFLLFSYPGTACWDPGWRSLWCWSKRSQTYLTQRRHAEIEVGDHDD